MDADRLLRRLGRRVRSRRERSGLSLRALAARASLSSRFLLQLELGQANISVRKLAGLARALDTTPARLLGGRDDEAPPSAIALLGLRGAGKTTVGRRLARRLRVPFVELDDRVEAAAGLSLGEIFGLHGESYYRRLERETLERVLVEAAGRPFVLATGGGLPTSPDTYALLRRSAQTVWLKARPEDHWSRVVQQGDRRPMAENPEAMADLRRLLAVREPLYAQAYRTVDTSRLGIEQVVAAAARAAKATSRRPA
jgi:XRE family aerobic/anaerobic benzoate catabolism transcriptional regulator